MRSIFNVVKSVSLIGCIGLVVSAGARTQAQELQPIGAVRDHDHPPILVQSMPVIERLPVKVIEPIDLKVGKSGQVYVADRSAQCIFRLSRDGEVSLPLENVSHIQRILVDADENLYVLTSSEGESQIQMVNPVGQSTVLCELTVTATTFARDAVGQFVVASKTPNAVVSISTAGEVTELARVFKPVSDLVVNAGGQTEALLTSGEIFHISPGGDMTPSGFAPADSSRLMLQPDGSMLALSREQNGRAELVSVSRNRISPAEFVTVATVPAGTQAVGFDSLGNFCLANPELRAVTKVTSHFRIPCPHCGRLTEMLFRKDREPNVNSTSRSF